MWEGYCPSNVVEYNARMANLDIVHIGIYMQACMLDIQLAGNENPQVYVCMYVCTYVI
jgi:hypothetical protein